MNFEKIEYPPRGTFKGRNFITPNVLGYYRGYFNGRRVFVEWSQGTGLDRKPLFGVTVRGIDGVELWREEYGGEDPSRCFTSKDEALEYIHNGLIEPERTT